MGLETDLPSRAQMGALISRLLARSPAFAEQLTIRDAQGRRVVVPVRETDPVYDLTKFVRQSGGAASFVAAIRDSGSRSLSLWVGAIMVSVSDAADDHHVPITPMCTVGDMLRVLVPGASITYRLAGNELSLEGLTTQDLPLPA